MRQQIKESFIRWAMRKQPPARSTITLKRSRIFILPTRYGILYGIMLLIMLAGSIHYSNSMTFLLTFLLAGLGSMAMWQTHRNLLGLVIEKQVAVPVFAGEQLRFPLKITNTSHEDRYALAFQKEASPLTVYESLAEESRESHLIIPTRQRGWITPGRFRIYTRFPLGLFQAWSWLEFDWSSLVFPKPISCDLPFNISGTDGGDSKADRPGTEDFSGLREYRPGDSSRHIAWKSMAHMEHPMTKQFSASGKEDVWLEWDRLQEPDVELRLSMLTYQVLEADRLRLEYGLRLPSKVIEPGSGELHRQDCLKALALHQ